MLSPGTSPRRVEPRGERPRGGREAASHCLTPRAAGEPSRRARSAIDAGRCRGSFCKQAVMASAERWRDVGRPVAEVVDRSRLRRDEAATGYRHRPAAAAAEHLPPYAAAGEKVARGRRAGACETRSGDNVPHASGERCDHGQSPHARANDRPQPACGRQIVPSGKARHFPRQYRRGPVRPIPSPPSRASIDRPISKTTSGGKRPCCSIHSARDVPSIPRRRRPEPATVLTSRRDQSGDMRQVLTHRGQLLKLCQASVRL